MIKRGTKLLVCDNTGAKVAKCIGMPGASKKLTAYLGDEITVVIKEAEPKKQVKEHEIYRAVIVRTKKEYRRKDGSYIRFGDNACVLIDKNLKTPLGNRIWGPIAREVKEKGYDKVASLAQVIL